MRANVLAGCAVVLSTMVAFAPLCAQGEVNTAPVATGLYGPFSLTCPTNMLVIAASSRAGPPESFVCSMYKADGTRFGATTTVSLPSSNNPILGVPRCHLAQRVRSPPSLAQAIVRYRRSTRT